MHGQLALLAVALLGFFARQMQWMLGYKFSRTKTAPTLGYIEKCLGGERREREEIDRRGITFVKKEAIQLGRASVSLHENNLEQGPARFTCGGGKAPVTSITYLNHIVPDRVWSYPPPCPYGTPSLAPTTTPVVFDPLVHWRPPSCSVL
ncbi:hypothetical protein CHARACLAT_003749 [Characodon lateralis]|uniref:Uncharacterized protein n=1 Tax=Characodon lateralis TaxID=208331 RepID=A0ABU7EZY0_9TELE|nr:hypothetical protein [Characodon lateralis]